MTKKIFAAALAIVFLLLFWAKPALKAQDPQVLVSVAPYAFFVQAIAGPDVPVTTLIPEGANPHLYEPTPREVARIRQAAVWIRLGESFDQKVHQVFLDQNPGLRIVDITQGIPLLSDLSHHDHICCEGHDLHIWLSPRLAKIQARTIASALNDAFPKQIQKHEERLQIFLQQLDELDAKLTLQLAPKKGEAILVSHPAFAYFCKDYDLTQLSVEMEGKEPLPKQVTELLQAARKHQVQIVLLEPQYSNKGAELIAKELGLPTATIDPYSADYMNNLQHLADIICP